jgi:hypothetical protein
MGPPQQQPIPFANAQQSGLEQLGGASPIALNVITRGTTIRRRPGLAPYSNAGVPAGSGPVGALLVTQAGKLYVVSGTSPNRHIYRLTPTGALNLSNIPEGDVRGTSRPQMLETESILAITGGERVQKLVLDTEASSPLANAPMGKMLAYHQYRLLIEDPDTTTLVDFSDLASGPTDFSGFETWGTGSGTAGFIQVNAKPGAVKAVAENTNEVFVWSERDMQVFAPDQQNVLTYARAQELGCGAPYSVIRSDEQFAWLDHLRRFVMSDGSNYVVLSQGMQQVLNDMTTVDDCFGYRYLEGDADVLVWTFPTDGRTFAYQKGVGWSQWTLWNPPNLISPWGNLVTSHHLVAGSGLNLVGLSDGYVAELSTRNTTDLVSLPIAASVTTGFQDRGSDNRKVCQGVQLSLKRGQTTGDEPIALLSWRDDLGPFGAPIEVGLGQTADMEVVVNLRSLGVYRRRQWKFEFTGTDDYQLISVSETFTIQGS